MRFNFPFFSSENTQLCVLAEYFINSWTSPVHQFSSVQLLSRAQLFVTPWIAARQASLSFTTSQGLLKLMSLSQWCHPTISSSVIPSPPVFSLSQHQGLFQWVSSLHEVANIGNLIEIKVSEFQLQHPVNTQGWSPLGLTGVNSLQSKGLSRIFSNITVQMRQFFGAQLSLWSNSHIHTWLLEKP